MRKGDKRVLKEPLTVNSRFAKTIPAGETITIMNVDKTGYVYVCGAWMHGPHVERKSDPVEEATYE